MTLDVTFIFAGVRFRLDGFNYNRIVWDGLGGVGFRVGEGLPSGIGLYASMLPGGENLLD